MHRYVHGSTLAIIATQKDLKENETIKDLFERQDAEIIVLLNEEGNYSAFDNERKGYPVEEDGKPVNSLYRAVGIAFEKFLGEEVHGPHKNPETEIDKIRRDLHILMRDNASGIENWLWHSLNKAIFGSKKNVIKFLGDYQNSSLAYMGWKPVNTRVLCA